MPDYSICIPYQPDGGPRDRLFDWLVRYYTEHCPEAEIVSTPPGGGEINRSRLRNQAVALATTGNLCILDADCLLSPDLIRKGFARLQESGANLVQLGGVVRLTEATTAAILAGDDWSQAVATDPNINRVYPPQGFTYWIQRHIFNTAGGFDEQFEGWGAEDEAFRFAVDTICGTAIRIPGMSYHLWHPVTAENSQQNPHYQANHARLCEYQKARPHRGTMAELVNEHYHARGMRRILMHTRQCLATMRAGAELSLHEFAQWLQRRGHGVDILVDRGIMQPTVIDGIRYLPCPGDPAPVYQQYDLAIGWHDPAPQSVQYARAAGIPAAAMLVNSLRVKPQHRDILLSADMRMGNSAEVAGHWQTQHILNPTVAESIRVDKPGNAVTLINLSDNKGAAAFWELARRLPDIPFLGVQGCYEKQIIPANIPANVTLLPPQADMRAIYGQTRILLMPSAYESFGRTALEAACSGIPTIASPTPGLQESLGDAGIFVDRADIDEYARQIRRLMRPAAYRAAAKKARARYATYWQQHCQQLESIEAALLAIAPALPFQHTARIRIIRGTLVYDDIAYKPGDSLTVPHAYAVEKSRTGRVQILE